MHTKTSLLATLLLETLFLIIINYKMIQNSAFNNKIIKKVSLIQVNRIKSTIQGYKTLLLITK